jgi:hypothetical protein
MFAKKAQKSPPEIREGFIDFSFSKNAIYIQTPLNDNNNVLTAQI